MKAKVFFSIIAIALTSLLAGCGDEATQPRVWKAEECDQYHREAKEAERKGDAKALAELGPLVSQCMRRSSFKKSSGRTW